MSAKSSEAAVSMEGITEIHLRSFAQKQTRKSNVSIVHHSLEDCVNRNYLHLPFIRTLDVEKNWCKIQNLSLSPSLSLTQRDCPADRRLPLYFITSVVFLSSLSSNLSGSTGDPPLSTIAYPAPPPPFLPFLSPPLHSPALCFPLTARLLPPSLSVSSLSLTYLTVQSGN